MMMENMDVGCQFYLCNPCFPSSSFIIIYVYIYAFIYAYIYAFIYAYIYVYIYAYIPKNSIKVLTCILTRI